MTVQVLLSTYNGETYLGALMESLLAQDYCPLEILVRDDGSRDGTPSMLREYAGTRPNIRVVFGENLGLTRSFFSLLDLSSPTADYFALCDQDDVWRADKVARAVGRLRQCPGPMPALYCSRLAVVDEALNPLGYSAVPQRGLSFRNALVQTAVFGCTAVMNRAARDLLLRGFPSGVRLHDWWIYLVVSAFGDVLYDDEPTVYYRRHRSNASPFPLGTFDAWRVKLRGYWSYRKDQPVVRQAEEFKRIYGASLSGENRRVLERFLEDRRRVTDRLRYALDCDVYRQSTRDHLLLKLSILLNRVTW